MSVPTTDTNTTIGTSCNYLTGCPHKLLCGYCMIMKMPCISLPTSITWTNDLNINTQSPFSSSSAIEVKA